MSEKLVNEIINYLVNFNINQITKIILGQDKNENEANWPIENITIKQNNEITT